MANYASLCPNCRKVYFTGWGVRKCPTCGQQMYQSRTEQGTFETFPDGKKYDTFATMFKEDSLERNLVKALFTNSEEAARLKEELDREQAAKAAAFAEHERNKAEAISKMLISSGFNFEGYRIVKYSGYISGDDATTIKRYAGLSSDPGHGEELTNALVKIRIQALKELKEAAYELGCNAVIGVDFDYLTLEPERNSLLNAQVQVKEDYVICVTANGNAVVIEKI